MAGTTYGWHRRGFELYRESSFVFLLGGALLLLLAFPFLSGSVTLRVVRAVLILALFLPSIYAHRHNSWLLATTSALVIASICTLIWELTTGSDVAELGHSAANAAYFCCLAVILIRFAASQETVTPNVVFAGMVVYVLLAFAWT